jgi:hypothetical protein
MVDDLDGGSAVETVVFGLDGAAFEIDLSKRNAAALRKTFERYIAAGRRSSPVATKRTAKSTAKATKAGGKATSSRGYDLVALREWAGANKVAVPSRGRIPQAIIEQYTAAGGR